MLPMKVNNGSLCTDAELQNIQAYGMFRKS